MMMNLESHYVGNGVTLNLRFLADDIADDYHSDQLIEFVLWINERRSDMDFTAGLHAKLGEIIREEFGSE